MKTALEEAHDIIYGDREKTYGDPARNLNNIAAFWEIYLNARGLLNLDGEGLTAEDVATMMMLLKIARLGNSPGHRDSLVDTIGYAALIDRINQRES
jgi:hypothetical protein